MLNIIWNKLTPWTRDELGDESPVVRAWINSRLEGEARSRRLADIAAKLADAESTAARLRAELAALTSAASPGG